MKYFKRKKIKLSLIDDYVKIILINNLYKNSIECLVLNDEILNLIINIKNLSTHLKCEYDKIFEKLKLNDVSLLILKKELNLNNSLFNSLNTTDSKFIHSTLTKIDETLKNILMDFKEKSIILDCS